MSIAENALTKLVEVLVNQEQAWANEASAFQVQAHQASGKSAACKVIKDTVIKLVAELEAQVPKTQEAESDPDPADLLVLEKRASADVCTHRARIKSGKYEWCDYKRTKHTDYCRKHNKELGLTNAKKRNTRKSS